ncbi:MAG TPA: DNA polymerase III subunit chi [Acetobacteraceae bacterium]|jgi:DNA polymerase III subunit chi|nr:DNA polymerase III subunit chi [Acetobacteraceae bacterium]
MTEIGFYHLTRSTLTTALPQLLARTLAAGQRAVVLCSDAQHVAALDRALWEAEDPWLPHGAEADGDPTLQPIWLATDDSAPNGGRYLFLAGTTPATPRLESFDRVFDVFDGNDPAALQSARDRWRAAKAAGHTLTYWQQGARGWEKKA